MLQRHVKISKKLVGKKLKGEWVFLNLENGEYYGLNETGSLIWDQLASQKDPKAILDYLQQVFRTDRSALEKDLKQFLGDLEKEELAEIKSLSFTSID